MKCAVIHPDGLTEVTDLKEDLKTLQGLVGGWLEAVYGAHDETGAPQVTILCNEEGKIHNLPLNRKATALWYAIDPLARGRDTLRGTVVVIGGADQNGNMMDIPAEVADMLIEGQP